MRTLRPTDNQQVAEINQNVSKSLSPHNLYVLIINGEFIELTYIEFRTLVSSPAAQSCSCAPSSSRHN